MGRGTRSSAPSSSASNASRCRRRDAGSGGRVVACRDGRYPGGAACTLRRSFPRAGAVAWGERGDDGGPAVAAFVLAFAIGRVYVRTTVPNAHTGFVLLLDKK